MPGLVHSISHQAQLRVLASSCVSVISEGRRHVVHTGPYKVSTENNPF